LNFFQYFSKKKKREKFRKKISTESWIERIEREKKERNGEKPAG
jgi:hypothetical protein